MTYIEKSCDLECVKKITTDGSSVNFIVDNYECFLNNYSCKPNETKFPKVKEGTVIDEEKSVRWNREEVQRLICAREEEVKRLNREKNEIANIYEDGIVTVLSKDYKLGKEECKLLWEYFGYEYKYNSVGVHTVLGHFETFMDLCYEKIKDLKKTKNTRGKK